MDLPEDVARVLDAERFDRCAIHLREAELALDIAREVLRELPSGRCAEDIGPERLPAELEELRSRVLDLVERAAEVARRAP